MVFLKEIEVENYKSYKGKQLIGPFKNFTAVIGPNGSGKSNLMDAICFVLGEKTQSLRVRKINDLIHGAPVGQPVSHRCHVTLIYEEDDGTNVSFTRAVTPNGAEYRINGKVVSMADYVAKLESINIFVKAKNFLVPQGTVESITTKSPKERTALFEEISRSGELKDDYDKRKTEMEAADEDTQFNYQKKRGIAAEKKEAKQEKDEAEKYQRLRDQLGDEQVQLHLFRLYYNEREVETIYEELQGKQKDLQRATEKKQTIEDELRDKKKEQGKLMRELNKLDQQIHELQQSVQKKSPIFMKAKKTRDHCQQKLQLTEKSLDASRKAADKHNEVVNSLKEDLETMKRQRAEYVEKLEEESQSQGLQLNEEQLSEYRKLKEEVGREVSTFQAELDGVEREQRLDSDLLQHEKRKQNELSNKISQKEKELDETKKRVDRFNDLITRDQREVAKQQTDLETLQEEVERANVRLTEIQKELEGISGQLSDARLDTNESSRQQKKTELVENLKRLFPGVYGRLLDLCQPSHKRYQLSVTKVLGKNMVAVIVDTERTARECIQYMKEQRAEPETFLPLDYLEVKPINEQLRELKRPKNAKLVIDVIQYDPPQIKRALQYACGNAIVCETADDARELAFGGKERHKAVSLDGTLFQKSGIISGGASDLKAKARRWDEKAVSGLRQKRETMLEEQKELHRIRRRGSEIPVMKSTLQSLSTRLKYEITDRDNAEQRQMKQLEKDLKLCRAEVQNHEPRITEIEGRIAEREEKISGLRDGMNTVEDRIFGEFCRTIGVPNIRQYEDREVQWDRNRTKKLLEYDNHIEKLQGQLGFETDNDKFALVRKLEEQLESEKKELKRLAAEEQKQLKLLEEDTKRLDDVKTTKLTRKSQTDDFEGELNEIKKRQSAAQKDLNAVQKQAGSLESRLEQKRSDRHSLLQACKMEDIDLPLARGSMGDIGAAEGDISSSQETPSSSQEQSSQSIGSSSQSTKEIYEREARLKINYDRLGDDYKDLDTDEEIKKIGDKLTKEVNDMQTKLTRITAPNLKANEKLDGVRNRLQETSEEFEAARKRAKKAKLAFEKVKKQRCDRFNTCYEKVAENIDAIYKKLSRNPSAQAVLQAQNPEEPYLDGLKYECVAPGKRFRPMDNLSGGEKTIAALALLFAIHSVNPSPFFVLDEIDAALDNTNIGKVASFIREESRRMQVIVISLKEEFYNRSDALIGIYPNPGPCVESGVLTLDLTQYRDQNPEDQRQTA